MSMPGNIPETKVNWKSAVRIIRSIYPPIDLFEDIADPADWPLIISAEQKTNPRLMETIGNIDLVPLARRISGPGASYLMAPFTHFSPDRPTRFSDGSFGVLYIASDFETALYETTHHHAAFMALTKEGPGWTSQFREIVLEVDATLHDLRTSDFISHSILAPDDYSNSRAFGLEMRKNGSDGLCYPSVRGPEECVGLFFPDLAKDPVQGRHLDYHWDGDRVDMFRDQTTGEVYRIE